MIIEKNLVTIIPGQNVSEVRKNADIRKQSS